MEASQPVNAALSDLARAFPQRDIKAGTLGVYLQNLSDLPVGAVVEACGILIRTSEFFPTVHAIRETVAEQVLALPSETEALTAVNSYRRGTARLHPLVREALTMVGGMHAFRVSDEPTVIRGQFARHYRELRAARIREAVIGDVALGSGPPLRELPA
jgi:hypothetical protein